MLPRLKVNFMTNVAPRRGIKGNSFRNLLFFLLLYIVGSPFLSHYPSLTVLAHASLSVSLFFTVYTVEKQRNQRSFAMVLLLPLLVLYWLGIYEIVHFTSLGAHLLFVIYFGLLIYSYILQIAHSRKVTEQVLFAALCLYLIIGLFWGSVYSLLAELSPGSYSGALLDKNPDNVMHIYNYFSMVTLTTLGYGDISPQTPGAASLCQLEAIVGQFFTAVLIAWLVGNYLADKQNR
jgi:voltage-gated potassium channel